MRMAADPEPRVRLEVARRGWSGDKLGDLRRDPDWRVRYEIVLRADRCAPACRR